MTRLAFCPRCGNKQLWKDDPICGRCGGACIDPPEAPDYSDPTKRRMIAYWGDRDTAGIRDPHLIQLAQREYLRGGEAEAAYAAETFQKIAAEIAGADRDYPEDGGVYGLLLDAILKTIRERHPEAALKDEEPTP